MSAFVCPLCGATRWRSRKLEPSGELFRECAAGCGYTWHYREDHLHGVERPEVVIDEAPELFTPTLSNAESDPS